MNDASFLADPPSPLPTHRQSALSLPSSTVLFPTHLDLALPPTVFSPGAHSLSITPYRLISPRSLTRPYPPPSSLPALTHAALPPPSSLPAPTHAALPPPPTLLAPQGNHRVYLTSTLRR